MIKYKLSKLPWFMLKTTACFLLNKIIIIQFIFYSVDKLVSFLLIFFFFIIWYTTVNTRCVKKTNEGEKLFVTTRVL